MKFAGYDLDSARQRLARLAGLLFFSAGACALAAATNSVMPYRIRAWQTDDGLPQNSVYAITQTRDGYLWVGTREGLARFDGVRFVALGENAPAELSRGWITALCTSRDGSLWIGCEGYGLARYQDGKFTRLSEADGLLSNLIRCLLEDKDGALWIGSEGGLSRYQDGRLRNFTEKNGLASNSVKGLCQDHRGQLRIATLRGLCMLDQEGTIHAEETAPRAPSVARKFVCEDRQRRLWTGSNEGLDCLDGDNVTSYGLKEGLPDTIVTCALEDRSGQFWVGTYHGVARLIRGQCNSPAKRGEGVWRFDLHALRRPGGQSLGGGAGWVIPTESGALHGLHLGTGVEPE